MAPEHPNAYSEPLWRVQDILPTAVVARLRDRVIAGRGDTAAAALRDLARQQEAQGRASSGQ
jgi:hypothetical protein